MDYRRIRCTTRPESTYSGVPPARSTVLIGTFSMARGSFKIFLFDFDTAAAVAVSPFEVTPKSGQGQNGASVVTPGHEFSRPLSGCKRYSIEIASISAFDPPPPFRGGWHSVAGFQAILSIAMLRNQFH